MIYHGRGGSKKKEADEGVGKRRRKKTEEEGEMGERMAVALKWW